MEFKDIVALVTGGAHGIGLACVQTLLARGARVVIADRDQDKLATAAKSLADQGTPDASVMTVTADITRADAVRAMFERVTQAWGPVDALVNNAGVSGGRQKLAEIPEEEWDRLITANLRGLYLCTRAALPAMYERRWGRIVNISSVAGISARMMASAHYAAAKGGITAFTRRVGVEAAPFNVAVNCVAPGLIENTGFTGVVKGELLERYLQGIPANRPGTAQEVAELVAFLCSDHAAYIIGQTIAIDGGATT